MAGTDSAGAPFQRIEELKQENEVLRDRLQQAEEDIDRLRRENEQLRKELKAAGRGSRHGKRKPKADPKRSQSQIESGGGSLMSIAFRPVNAHRDHLISWRPNRALSASAAAVAPLPAVGRERPRP